MIFLILINCLLDHALTLRNFILITLESQRVKFYYTLLWDVNDTIYQAPVVQMPDNFIRWIRYYSGSKIYFTLIVVQGLRTLPNVAVVRVCIFTCTQGNTEIFAQIETVG